MSPQDNRDSEDDRQSDLSIGPRDWRQFRASLISRPIVVTDENRQVKTNASLEEGAGVDVPEDDSSMKRNAAQSVSWAHPLVTPERGCVLVANMKSHTFSQTIFGYAVVTLVEYGKEGSLGFITNR